METMRIKLLMSACFILFLIAISTCAHKKSTPATDLDQHTRDSSLIQQLLRDKKDQQEIFEYQLSYLQQQKDSLKMALRDKKQALSEYRSKAAVTESRLKKKLHGIDSLSPCPDSLKITALEYIDLQQQKDSICSETIDNLEAIVARQDSSCKVHERLENNLRSVISLQEKENKMLSDQLSDQLKSVQKLKRQKKWLKTGVVILSGITAGLMVSQLH